MRLLLALFLCTASCNDPLTAIDQEICCLEKQYIALMGDARRLEEIASYLYWKRNSESDVRALRWRACRRRCAAQRVCCRIQKLRIVREAIVRQAEKGVFYGPCAGC